MAFSIRFRGEAHDVSGVIVGRVSQDAREDGCVLSNPDPQSLPRASRAGIRAALTSSEKAEVPSIDGLPHLVLEPVDLAEISLGDIVALHPNGGVNILFKAGRTDNALFVTERCNSNCLMCSQPPKNRDDLDSRFRINAELIRLIPKDTPFLGMTGGEPTLLGRRLLSLLRELGTELPNTEVQVLSNGRAFAWPTVARKVSDAIMSPTIFCIPLYSDHAWAHDYVVQAKGAFQQTLLGLHHLANAGVRVEIRVVLHAQTVRRLPALAEFIYRNVPFAEHVALMGLEYTGYTPFNDELLWVEPESYHDELREAVTYLDGFGMAVSLYNLPLCLLPKDLWGFARSSISGWKREYHEECAACEVRAECGGLFSTSRRHSARIHAINHQAAQ